MYFLLILLLIIKLIISHITLPFFLNEISLNNLNHSLIMESLYKTNSIINISLGSPEQNLQLIIKHSIFDLIIPSSQLKTKKPINKFNENVSLTYNKSKRRLNPIEGIIVLFSVSCESWFIRKTNYYKYCYGKSIKKSNITGAILFLF